MGSTTVADEARVSVKCPVLILQALDDPIIPLEGTSRALDKDREFIYLTTEAGGHGITN